MKPPGPALWHATRPAMHTRLPVTLRLLGPPQRGLPWPTIVSTAVGPAGACWPTFTTGGMTTRIMKSLAEVLGSEKMAASIINNWQTFRHHFARELVDLQQAADATRQLLTIVGKRWQTQPLSALSAHATFIASRLERWHNKFGTVESHADKTPAIVLSSFSNKSMDHVLIETQVDETQSRIRRQLTDGEITIEQISDTLDWLNLASASALEYDLEIESIVEHLHIG